MITVAPYSITQTTFLSGGKDLDASATTKGICWSTTPIPTTSNNSAELTLMSGNTVNYVLLANGLSANTKYYVRSYIVTGTGLIYGTEYSFITKGVLEETEAEACSTFEVELISGKSYTAPPGAEVIGIEGNIDNLKTSCPLIVT